MPYSVNKVSGGYKVAKKDGSKMSSGRKHLSDRPLTKAQAEKQKKAVEIAESKGKKKEPAISGISPANSKKLREHAKNHEGGMTGKHMKNMVKFMRAGDSFTVAHNKAKKLDNNTPTRSSRIVKNKPQKSSYSS